MAENGGGPPQVRILRPETSVTSESAIQEKLIGAASIFADLLRPTYGPMGLDKMLYKSNGQAAITNDGAKIVSELMVKHPTAKAFVSLGKSQESAAGDGVTGCILFAGALMHEAGLLIRKGLHPLVIVEGYREASDITISKLDEIAYQYNEEDLLNVAKTALTGKVTTNNSEKISELVVKAVNQIKSSSICESENILMAKSSNNTPMSVELINGLIIEKRLHLDKTPSELKNCKVALINGELGFSTTEVLDMDEESYRKGEWKIDMFGQAITPASPLWIQGSKHQIQAIGEEEVIESLSEHISELYVQNKDSIIIWGAGGSLNKIAKLCGLNTTLLGIDISKGNQLIGTDLSENEIIEILEYNDKSELVLLLSPMGGQGFLIGRGNLQLSPIVLRKIGIENIMGVATPAKLLSISRIRIDTGDTMLDKEIRGKKYIKMIQGYRTIKIVKIDSPN